MQVAHSAELFARDRYAARVRPDGIQFLDHLNGVVSRLKGLGITDQEVLAAAWLNGTINDGVSTFDEIDKRFGSRIAVLVLSLTQDRTLPKGEAEKQFVSQLKGSSTEAKMIEICDISTALKDLRKSPLSRTKRSKQAKKYSFYISVMKSDLSKATAQFPGIQVIVSGINEIFSGLGLRQIIL